MSLTLPRHGIERIAIFRALNLGDLLCAIPAIRALRAAYPQADITLIGLPCMADFARRFCKYFSSFVSFPGAPGLPEQPFDQEAFSDYLMRERAVHYDLVLQMHGNGTFTNPLIRMLRSSRYAGYFEADGHCSEPRYFMPYPDGIPEVRRHLRLMEHLGIPAHGEALEFPVSDDEWSAFDAMATAHGFSASDFVCIHPGARDVRRWWSPKKFAQVADALADRGKTIIFTGTAAEAAAVDAVRALMKHRSLSLAGQTDLGLLAALVGRARLLVSNDTGVSHIAAAMGTASVVIFLASDPVRWAPLDNETHQAVHPENAVDVNRVMLHVERALQFSAVTTTS